MFVHCISMCVLLDYVPCLLAAGVAKAEAGDFKEAIRLFSKTLQLDPSHEAASKHLEQAKLQLRTATTKNGKNSTR